jgi:hypothetical protein
MRGLLESAPTFTEPDHPHNASAEMSRYSAATSSRVISTAPISSSSTTT